MAARVIDSGHGWIYLRLESTRFSGKKRKKKYLGRELSWRENLSPLDIGACMGVSAGKDLREYTAGFCQNCEIIFFFLKAYIVNFFFLLRYIDFSYLLDCKRERIHNRRDIISVSADYTNHRNLWDFHVTIVTTRVYQKRILMLRAISYMYIAE